jgi:hypothetical protein
LMTMNKHVINGWTSYWTNRKTKSVRFKRKWQMRLEVFLAKMTILLISTIFKIAKSSKGGKK